MPKQRNTKPARKCMWCGGGNLSHEHIWSQWTHDLVPPVPDGSHVRLTTIRSPKNPLMRGIESKIDRQGSTNKIQLRFVCCACNSGWMNVLESEVRPIVSPLIGGQAAIINLRSAKILARWISMKMMVAEQTSDVVTTQMERDHLRCNEEVPSTWKIWIARHDGGLRWRHGYARCACSILLTEASSPPVHADEIPVKNTQIATIGIGQLLFVATHTLEVGLDFDLPPKFKKCFHRIWPADHDFLWPPGIILTQFNVDEMVHGFDQLERQPRVHWKG